MSGLTISFSDLNPGQVEYLLNAYRIISGDDETPVARTEPTEYDTARAFVEQPPVSPAVPAPVAKPAAAGGELDNTGVPWHPEYHASTKTKTVKGQWSLKKGVDKDAAERWRKQHATSAPVAATSAPSTPLTVAQLPPQTPAMQMPAAPGAGAAPTLTPVDYGTWYTAFQQAMQSGRITEAVLNHINGTAGVPDASHYATNDNARAVSYPMLRDLAA